MRGGEENVVVGHIHDQSLPFQRRILGYYLSVAFRHNTNSFQSEIA